MTYIYTEHGKDTCRCQLLLDEHNTVKYCDILSICLTNVLSKGIRRSWEFQHADVKDV